MPITDNDNFVVYLPFSSSARKEFVDCMGEYLEYFHSCMLYNFRPCGLGDPNLDNICSCACHTKRLIKEYELSYTTGLLYA